MGFPLFNKYIIKKHSGIKIRLRKKSVDQEVYDYVFVEKYHRPFKEITVKEPVILDLGANIGLTIIDFKILYPASKIFAYELDKDNYDLSVLNCKKLTGCYLHNEAIWCEPTQIKYNKGVNNDAYKIEINIPQNENTISVNAVTVGQIIERYQLKSIDYVKLDIEGAEYEVFQKNLEWLNITKQIKIEVHYGAELFEFFKKKLEEHGFKTVKDTHHWSTLIGYKDEG
jgi:FkbM family methyltransferase